MGRAKRTVPFARARPAAPAGRAAGAARRGAGAARCAGPACRGRRGAVDAALTLVRTVPEARNRDLRIYKSQPELCVLLRQVTPTLGAHAAAGRGRAYGRVPPPRPSVATFVAGARIRARALRDLDLWHVADRARGSGTPDSRPGAGYGVRTLPLCRSWHV